MRGKGVAIIAGIVAAVAVGVALALPSLHPTVAKNEPVSNFPIKVDFARVIPYENITKYPDVVRGYVLNIRVTYPAQGPPRPFYLLFIKGGESWSQVTNPDGWVKEKNHGFEVISSSKQFDLFTEYYPFNSTLIPNEMRLYCANCTEQWSSSQIVWQGVDTKITKLKAFAVAEGRESYTADFALGNNQIDTLPASGTVEFKITDPYRVILYDTNFKVNVVDFRTANDPVRLLHVPDGGKAYYEFTIPTKEIVLSPSGQKNGFAFIWFTMDDGRQFSTGTKVQLPPFR